MRVYGEYFCGNKISNYGLEHGYVDYRTLAKAFDAVLNNDIMNKTYDIGYWEQESGFVDNSEEIEEKQEMIEKLEEKIEELEDEIIEIENTLERLEDTEEDCDDELYSIEYRKGIIEDLKEQIESLEREVEELENEQEDYPEVYQWFIVDNNGASILKDCNEIVYYNEELDMYLWGVTHWGTSWDYVLTNIKIEKE